MDSQPLDPAALLAQQGWVERLARALVHDSSLAQRRAAAPAQSVLALDEAERTAILLRHFEGLTAEEIARRAGIPAGTVRSRLSSGCASASRPASTAAIS